jgi:ubiquinone/menaquinone biosynthesis C-methylase UbiE
MYCDCAKNMKNLIKREKKHVCPWWKAYTFETPLRRLQTPIKQVLSPYLSQGMTFLDLGCGMGFFSIKGAKIVGDKGKVIALDIQKKMLDILEKKSKKAKLNHIIQTHLAKPDDTQLNIDADFALAMWMVHETPDFFSFFKSVYDNLKAGSNFLIVEPNHHVSSTLIDEEIEAAKNAGFEFCQHLKIGISNKAYLLRK